MSTMMQSDFHWFGNRNYVRGVDQVAVMFDAVQVFGLGRVLSYSASFHRWLREQGEYFVLQADASLDPAWCSLFRLTTTDGGYCLALRPDGREITSRLPDDTDGLLPETRVDAENRTMSVVRYPAQRLVPVIVTGTKALHNAIFPKGGYGAWFVSQIDLRQEVADTNAGAALTLCITQHMGETMTRSRLVLGGHDLGHIIFSRKNDA